MIGCGFLLELGFLEGRDRLKDYRVEALLTDTRAYVNGPLGGPS